MNHPRFPIDEALLDDVRARLADHEVYWLLGGAGSGKSTVCRRLAGRCVVQTYDMDAHVYGAYHGRFSPTRHPANWAWSTAESGLGWLLALSWEAFDAFNHAAAVEYLDLLVEDLAGLPAAPWVVDGGLACAGVLARAIPPGRIACLAAPSVEPERLWSQGDRAAMREWVLALPDGEAAWRTFLDFDRGITRTLEAESRACGVRVFRRRDARPTELAERVARHFGLCAAPRPGLRRG